MIGLHAWTSCILTTCEPVVAGRADRNSPVSRGARAAGEATPPTALNALTTVAYMLKRNAAAPQLRSVIPLLGGAGFTAEQLDSLLGIAFGVSGAAIPNTNYVAELQVGRLRQLRG